MNSFREVVAAFAARQDSVITTAQCADLGVGRSWVARQCRDGRWQRLHRGVLVVYSGPLTWRTRARAALLYAGSGAALSHASAGHVHEITDRPPCLIDVTIPRDRQVARSPGVRIHRCDGRQPERRARFTVVSRADATLDMVEQTRNGDAALAVLCASVRGGTSPGTILASLEQRPRMRHRGLVCELLGLVSEGIESPLELWYRSDVERRHGLPRSRLQVRQVIEGRWIRADGIYEGMGVRVELDGELAHPGGRTDDDVWRDNAVVIARDELTLRYRWGHVRGTPCRTAAQVVVALRSQGWTGTPRPCGPECRLR